MADIMVVVGVMSPDGTKPRRGDISRLYYS